MVKVNTLDIPDELKHLANKSFQKRDRFILGVVQSQRSELSKKRKKELSRVASVHSPQENRGSLLKYFATYWGALSLSKKDIWKSAGAVCGLTGWQLFISDSAARIKKFLSFGFDPSLFWQVRVGKISLNVSSKNYIISQSHALNYWVASKIKGKPWKKELKLLTEFFSLPLTLKIRYKSSFVVAGSLPFARFFADVITSYQGVNRVNRVEIPLTLSTDWTFAEITLSKVNGYIIKYDLYFELNDITGYLLIDNLRAEHSGQNWVRDPRCDDVSKIFNKGFSAVNPFWVVKNGASFGSFESVFDPSL